VYIIIALFGLFIAGLAAWGFVAPGRMMDTLLAYWNRPSGIYLAIGVRVVLGVLFILAAADTKWPLLFEILGYLMLLAAAVIAVVGKERLTRFIMWWVNMPLAGVRVWLVVGFAFGLLILYGAL
jgi:hypothetical protein